MLAVKLVSQVLSRRIPVPPTCDALARQTFDVA